MGTFILQSSLIFLIAVVYYANQKYGDEFAKRFSFVAILFLSIVMITIQLSC